ncbi:hypothetical protein B484DRAFT_424972 [Ochromonadaceae sp. CCMP2298]|nr:hypothetical protein B484DRAFT_424972 [Ochromonadaceae sp. CCMP2298]
MEPLQEQVQREGSVDTQEQDQAIIKNECAMKIHDHRFCHKSQRVLQRRAHAGISKK